MHVRCAAFKMITIQDGYHSTLSTGAPWLVGFKNLTNCTLDTLILKIFFFHTKLNNVSLE